MIDPQTLADREDAIGELQRMLQLAHTDSDLLEQLEKDIGELVRRLPHAARTDVEDEILAAAIAGDHVRLIADMMPYLTARLTMQEN
jgi:hypothetical protein